MVYVEAALVAAENILTLEGLLLILIGTFLGLMFGALPGLGGTVGLAILVPLTFPLDPFQAFMVLSSALGGAAFGGSVTAILLNIPGSAPNAATLLDGHPLAKQGRANFAIGASAVASGAGAIFGLAILLLSLPILRQILRLFGPPEYFAVSVFGLFVLAIAIRGSFLNGLISGCLGLLISFIGFNPVTGGTRFTFGVPHLMGGIELVVIIIGLFAIAEMIDLLSKRESISGDLLEPADSVIEGMKAVPQNFRLFVQSSVIGVLVGMIPAAGGSVSNFVSYFYAKGTVKDGDSFGTGDVRGVIASEAANDSKDGGSLVPTLTFGIPGSGPMAVMLGAFILHGIVPGPFLLEDHLDIVFVIVFSLLLSNLLTSTVGLLTSGYLAKITIVPIEILGPIVLVISLLGAYSIRLSSVDVVLATIVGVFGLLMIKYDFSRIALILGFVLGPIMETSFHQTVQMGRGSYMLFYTRPVTVGIFVLLLLVLAKPLLPSVRGSGD